jgi:hypothetical protein
MFFFAILGLTFKFYTSRVLKSSAESELGSILKSTFKNSVINDPSRNDKLNRLLEQYSNTSSLSELNNQWLFKMIYVVIGIFIMIIIVIAYTTHLSCVDIDIGALHVENILIFLGVCLIEFLFFKYAASKYTPIIPSEVMDDLVASLEKK